MREAFTAGYKSEQFNRIVEILITTTSELTTNYPRGTCENRNHGKSVSMKKPSGESVVTVVRQMRVTSNFARAP